MTSEYKETKRDYKAAATQLEETQRAFKNLVDLDPRIKLMATETEQIADVEKKVCSDLYRILKFHHLNIFLCWIIAIDCNSVPQ